MPVLSQLAKHLEGQLDQSVSTQRKYALDESIFTVTPTAVVHPKHTQDIETVMSFCHEHDVPVTMRGGGSGTAGQSIGAGIVLDVRTHMNQLVEIESGHAIVQPGLFLEELNQAAVKQGQKFGPDPGSRAYAAMGGVVANNAAGAHALAYGMTRDHVIGMDCVLSDGQRMPTQKMPAHFSALVDQVQSQQKIIDGSAVHTTKNSSGYHLESLLQTPPNFAGIITGSEGTLCAMTQIEVGLVDVPKQVTFKVLAFGSRIEAAQALPALLKSTPSCVELVDEVILQALRQADPQTCDALGLPKAGATLWVEWIDESTWTGTSLYHTENPQDIQHAWAFRSRASKLLHAQALERKPLRCIEDGCVPVKHLPAYLKEVEALLKAHDCPGAIFGHIGNGHLHINPAIDVTQPALQARIQKLMDDFYALVWKYQGTISGEHGDGYLRAPYAKQQWAARWPLFEALKQTFDPKGLLNPGKKIPTTQTYELKPWS